MFTQQYTISFDEFMNTMRQGSMPNSKGFLDDTLFVDQGPFKKGKYMVQLEDDQFYTDSFVEACRRLYEYGISLEVITPRPTNSFTEADLIDGYTEGVRLLEELADQNKYNMYARNILLRASEALSDEVFGICTSYFRQNNVVEMVS